MTTTDRDILILQNLQYAKNVARQQYGRNRIASYDEMESAAFMGLVEAAGKYIPEENDSFQGYAYPRIAGAIGDFLRELRWGSRANPACCEEIDEEMFVTEDRHDEEEEFFNKVTFDLNKPNKVVMRLYYVEEKKIREIADEIGVHESRISQVLSESRTKLKASWRDHESELWSEVA
jgi:RNA polymerase sigma factor (sigma-70 family)